MGLDGCGQLCKVLLIIFNILFALVGFAMLGLGLWLRFSSETQGFFNIDLNTQQFVIGVTVLIVLGAVMLIVAVFGDYGACNENRTALSVFTCLLAILAGVEIGAGVIAYMRSDEVGQQLAMFYTTVYAQYVDKGDPGMAITLTVFHNGLECCGLVGALDLLVRKTCPDISFFKTLSYPACPPVIINLFETKGPLMMGFFLGTAALLISALVCSSILTQQLKKAQQSPAVHYNRAVY